MRIPSNGGPQMRKCDVCGKEYINPVSSIYKETIKGKTKDACSYTCWMKLKSMKKEYSRRGK